VDNTQNLDNLIDDINQSIEDIRSSNVEIKDSDLPSNLQLMLSGVSDSRAIDFLFSGNIDKLLEKLFKLIESGDIEKILGNEEQMEKVFKSMGFGEGSFKGPVSKSILSSITNSMDSRKYNMMKSNLRKVKMLLKNLNRQSKYFKDPGQKKKYKDAVHAIKKVIQVAAKIYKNRRIVSKRVFDGLSNIVTEDYMPEEKLIAIG